MGTRSAKERRASPYIIRAVDPDEYAFDIDAMLAVTDLPRLKPQYEGQTVWWLAFFDGHPVAYLAIMQSRVVAKAAYLIRVGVMPAHRGNCLQLRLMRCAERWARCQGFAKIVSDTRANPPSANNFIRAGYETFAPTAPWSFAESIYWRKDLVA